MVKLYWCRGKGDIDKNKQNFGDYLSPLLVEMLARQPVSFAPIHKADMIAVGSIMNREKKARRFFLPHKLHVWGAGTDSQDRAFSGRHYYHAVRGEKTLGQVSNVFSRPALGDPGLLVDHWWGGRSKPAKRYRVGLIPHYVDATLPEVQQVACVLNAHVIDVFWPVEEVLKSVLSCDFIVSSSMHGLIVADAFGIPNRRLVLSRGIISDYKFIDYYSAFAMDEPSPLLAKDLVSIGFLEKMLDAYERPGIEEIKLGLMNAFPDI